MSLPIWVVPAQPQRAHFKVTLGLLRSRAVRYTTISPGRLRGFLDLGPPPAAVVHGGAVSLMMLEAQRWLAEFRVPTLVLVEELKESYEATLLERGARDVIGIPTTERKLGSRLEALARSPLSLATPPRRGTSVGGLQIDPAQRSVSLNNELLHLTKSEFDLLLILGRRPGEVVTRAELGAGLQRPALSDKALESHINRLRSKLRLAGAPDLVQTVRGVGYRLRAENGD